jgi:transposase
MHWTHETPTRVRFKTLLDEGYSVRGAARKLKIPRSSARYFVNKPDRLSKPPGALPKISDAQVQEIIKWFTGHFDRRQMSLQQIREHFHLDCCDRTLLNTFARHGYHYHVPDCKPALSQANRLKRWSFSIANWDRPKEYWRRGRFTDETITRTDLLRRRKILRARGERRRLDCIQFTFHSSHQSVMAWAAIGYNYKSKLYFVSYEGEGKGFTQQKYADQILRGPLKEIFEQPGDFFCVEDNSNVHGKKDTAANHGFCNAVRLECHIYSINWPPSSPDLNPIENIWRVLKQRLRNRKPHGGWKLEDLKAAMVDIWENEISIELINRFIDTMPQRLEKVRLRKGGPSGW